MSTSPKALIIAEQKDRACSRLVQILEAVAERVPALQVHGVSSLPSKELPSLNPSKNGIPVLAGYGCREISRKARELRRYNLYVVLGSCIKGATHETVPLHHKRVVSTIIQ